MGNIQLVDPLTGALAIAAEREFRRFFLEHFASVSDGVTACGAAFERGERVIIDDVARSPLFAGTPGLHVMLSAGAVQSTPLIASSGRILGVLSTHYRRPQRPAAEGLKLLDDLARRTADVLDGAAVVLG